jgi:succinate dehydrogenase / fumarate reductase flavoprotein subunit
LRAAIELAERGVDVLAVGKRPKADAHTALAAGGVNAALATMDPEDSWRQHVADTLKESYLLAIPTRCRSSPRAPPRASATSSATA